MSGEFKKIADEIADPFLTILEDYNRLGTSLTGHEKPEKPIIPYSIDGLAAKFYEAADAIASMHLNPDLKTSDYSVSLAQLGSCVSQDSALKTLNDYVGEMEKGTNDAQSTIDYLNKVHQGIIELNKAVVIFTNIAGTLASDPLTDWDDYFSSAWWDLDRHLARGIAEFDNAVAGQVTQITKNRNSLKLQADNLRSNLALLKPNWCILGGSWAGQCINDQAHFLKGPASLSLTNNGSQSGTYTFDGQAMPTQTVNISGKVNLALAFGLPGAPARMLQGSFDTSYHQFTGKVTVPNSPGLTMTCSMTGNGY